MGSAWETLPHLDCSRVLCCSRFQMTRMSRQEVAASRKIAGSPVQPSAKPQPIASYSLHDHCYDSYPFRSQPHRLSPHRRRAHRALFLGVCPQAWRHLHSANRGYRSRALDRAIHAGDSRRHGLAGARLRRRAVLPDAAAGPLSRSCGAAAALG